jgi:hypothetical protein
MKNPAENTKNIDKIHPIVPPENIKETTIKTRNKKWYRIPNKSPLSFFSYLMPEIRQARPIQSKIFAIPLPITEPRETSEYPFKTLAPDTKKSGDAVPIAKMLAPIAKEEILKRLEIPIAPRMKSSPEAIINAKKTAIKSKNIIFKFFKTDLC